MANEGFILPNGIPHIRRPAPRTSKEALRRKLDEKPEAGQMQRVKTLTQEQKGRWAIDVMARDAAKSAEMHGKPQQSVEAHRDDMRKVAEKSDKRKALGEK